MYLRSRLLSLCLLLLLGLVANAKESHKESQKESRADGLEKRIMPLIDAHRGDVAVAIKHLTLNKVFSHQANKPMPTASLIKFPVMVEAYRQAEASDVDMSALIELTDADKVPGSGLLTPHFSSGAKLSLRDAIRLMIVYSDNTATNLVLDQIGIKSTAETMQRLGLPHTKIHGKVFRRETSEFPERSKEFGLGSTTANETIRLYELLWEGKLVSKSASEAMMKHLLACDDKTKLAQQLPKGVKLAHKGGAISTVRCDGGLILSPSGPIAVCVLTRKNKDRRWSSESEGNRLCGAVAKAAYDYFNPAARTANRLRSAEPLSVGASGRLVESLQRTLNARLKPSPELSIDGEFGPMTEAAVKRFQEQRELTVSGNVDAATWKALGALVANGPAVPAPEIVNSAKLPIRPLEPLSGAPFVTCKAWAIADATTGKVLWGHDESKALDIASTTKIMTAYLVLKLAAETPSVLNEEITFSQRADETRGSTSSIRAGERLSVRECLYGLLLPSGNDASVALAEHFGARLAKAGRNSDGASKASPAGEQRDPLEEFVAAMNRAAKQLGMESTAFRNPHGLTAKGHVSSAADLIRLAHAAFEVPLFADYVKTRQRGATVIGPGGYRRNLIWRNTNRLLGGAGYSGVKTGTTTAAGACLVSRSARGQDQLLMVVLGAKSSDARYVDSRNLYRWAWLELAKKQTLP